MTVKNTQPSEHVFLKELESLNGFDYKIDVKSFLLDVKVLLREYYAGTFTEQADALTVRFNNGQSFILSAKEVF